MNGSVFTPITTERLVIRHFTPGDVDNFHARRDDPEVARYQDWVTPYSRDEAERIVASLVAMEGPERDGWWMVVVADRFTGEVYGDLSVHLDEDGHTSEIGYTFDAKHWGMGYAIESLEPMLEYLFDVLGVTRVFGMLHPDNPASAMVMERMGFRFEGHTRRSFWLDGEVSDDWIYGMLREDWEEWRTRVRTSPVDLRLVEVSTENVADVAALETHKTQERFVAPMAKSFTDALFPEVVDGEPVVPWMRAIEADGAVVGFVMLALATAYHPEPYLWRLLIDRMHQRRGIGHAALDLVEEACVAMGDSALVTSWTEGKGSPRPFYLSRGYVPTGRVIGGETEARKALDT